MDSAIASRLLALNRDFYERFGESFSATRRRIQPGVRRVLDMLKGDESILDLGCGNGELARALARRGHRGPYLGVDFSLPLLKDAESQPQGFSARFLQADLTRLPLAQIRSLLPGRCSLITAFAVLHHIPSHDLRLDILQKAHKILADDGRFIISNWQFLNSPRLKARIQDWSQIGLAPEDVDDNDYLLDWRSKGKGLRYVHYYSEEELSELAKQAGLRVVELFYSDGEGGRLSLYQIWHKVL